MTGTPSHEHDPLSALLDRKGSTWRTYPVPDARVMFVQVHKNACTSLKWMVAGIAGEDLRGFGPSLEASAGDEDDIHDRRQWRRTPWLDQLDPEIRSQIHPDNGWFVFAVTRDPRSRLFSAWQSKLLLENPGYTHYKKEPWYPRHPVSTDSIVEDFAEFVDLLVREPGHRIRADAHFSDQVELLHEDLVTYTHIYDVRDLGRLQADLRRHLAGIGWTGDLTLPRANRTPLSLNARVLDDGLDAQIQKIYAADFERFGDRWNAPHVAPLPTWTAEDLAMVDQRAAVGRRIGYLRDRALDFRRRAAVERKRADEEKRRADRHKKRAHRLRRQLGRRSASAPQQPRSAARVVAGDLRRRILRVALRSGSGHHHAAS